MQKYNFADNFKKISAPKQELNFSDLESFEELINKSKDIIYTDKDVDLRLFKLIESKRLLESSLRHQYYRKHSVLVNTPSKLKSLARKLKQVSEFAFDTETTTLRVLSKEVGKCHPLVCITISFGEHFNYYIPVSHTFTSGNINAAVVISLLQPIFNRKDLKLYMWNAKFDLHALKTFGLEVKTDNIFDGMIASWLLDVSTPNGLKHNTEVLLGIPQDKIDTTMKTVTGLEKKSVGLKAANRAPFNLVRIHNGAPYALDDSYYTYINCKILEQRLIEEDFITIYEKMYKPFIKVIFNMERAGMCVDVPKLKQMQIDMNKDLESLEFELLSLAGVQLNLGSSQQLAELLFGYSNSKNPNEAIIENSFGFPIESTTKTGAPVTDSKAIRHLAKKSYQIKRKQEGVEFCKLLLEFKKLQKLKSAFVDGLLEQLYDDGKAHPSFNIIGTTSGRISCSAPNLMQLPNAGDDDKYQIRDVFIGDMNEDTGVRDHIISVDFSNLEMRVLAHFSEDPNLCETFREERDAHGDTAVKMFRLDCNSEEVKHKYKLQRNIAKTLNFLDQVA